jgi:thiol-disulfide isomerase/thioredoxin
MNDLRSLMLCMTFSFYGFSYSQTEIKTDSPIIGKRSPEFTMKGIEHFEKNEASLDDFKGKWLILDFWTRGCSSCIASFPETNELQKEFAGKVQFMMVAYTASKYKNFTRSIFEKCTRREFLSLPVVYDSLLTNIMDVSYFPHVVWIDDKGIIRAITSSVKKEDMHAFLNGKDPMLGNALETNNIPIDFNLPFFVNGNGGNDDDFYIRSLLTGWKKGLTSYSFVPGQPIGFTRENIIAFTNSSLKELYTGAYGDTIGNYMASDPDYGKWWYTPVLELKDSSAFENDYDRHTGFYCYNLIVPPGKAGKKKMQEIFQSQLKNYFGYEVQVEKRIMPYWKLIATEEAKTKLRTKGGIPEISGSFAGAIFKNQPVYSLIKAIWATHQSGPPFTDETGIKNNIDFDMDCTTTEFDQIKNVLQKNGLDLVLGKKEINVIVIRDPKN